MERAVPGGNRRLSGRFPKLPRQRKKNIAAAEFDGRQPPCPLQRLHHVDAGVENFGRGSTAIKTPLRFLLSSEAHLYRWDLTLVN